MVFYNHIGRKHDSKMLSQCVCYTSEIDQILSPVLFQLSLYFPFLIHRIFYLLVSALFIHALQYCIQAGALLRPKNGYLVGLKCVRRTRARAHVGRAQALGVAAA